MAARLCLGDIISAIAITEPDTGSDVAAIKAVRDGNEYVINGQKTFISCGIHSNLVIVAAKTDAMAAPKGEPRLRRRGHPRFHPGRQLKKMGRHSQDTAELIFEDCRVPVANLLGKEGKGFYYIMEKLQGERLVGCVMAQTMAEAMLDMTIKYCKEERSSASR